MKLWGSDWPYAASVAEVDPDEDTIARWVVAHYRYDADRRERRHVVVAAFDSGSWVDCFAGGAEHHLQVGAAP